jgi:hypothetical protein
MGHTPFYRRIRSRGPAVGFSIALALIGCVDNNRSGGDNAARAAQQQKALRDAAVIHQAVQPAITPDAELSQYIQLIGTRLVEGARQSGAVVSGDVQFFAVLSPVHNVIAPGGQSIYITSALLQQCQGEEDVAAALAHGLAHLIDRHVQRRPPPDSNDPVVLTLVMTSGPASSADEAQADRDGLQYFAHAGWNPERFAEVLVRVGNRDGGRIQDIRNQGAQLRRAAMAWRKPPVADDRSFSQLLQRLGSGRAASDERAAQILAAFPGCFTTNDQSEQSDARKRLGEMLPQTDLHLHHGLGAGGSGSNPQ